MAGPSCIINHSNDSLRSLACITLRQRTRLPILQHQKPSQLSLPLLPLLPPPRNAQDTNKPSGSRKRSNRRAHHARTELRESPVHIDSNSITTTSHGQRVRARAQTILCRTLPTSGKPLDKNALLTLRSPSPKQQAQHLHWGRRGGSHVCRGMVFLSQRREPDVRLFHLPLSTFPPFRNCLLVFQRSMKFSGCRESGSFINNYRSTEC